MKSDFVLLVVLAVGVIHILCATSVQDVDAAATQMAILPANLPTWFPKCAEKNITKENCVCPTLKSLELSIELACPNNSVSNKTNNATQLTNGKIPTTNVQTTPATICTLIGNVPCSSCKEILSYQKNCMNPTFFPITEEDIEIKEECQKLRISGQECHCEKLYHFEKLGTLCGLNTEEVRRTFVLNVDLESFCIDLNITKEECVCPDLRTTKPQLGDICDLYKNNNVELQVTCDLDKRVETQAGFTIAACVFGVIGNFLVLIVRSQQWHNSIHYKLISGLAVADLLFSILQILYHIPKMLVGCKWAYGLAMCKILHSCLGLSYAIDLGFIVIIAIERYMAIVHPFTDLLTDFRVYLLLIWNIVFSMVAVIPAFMVLTIDDTGRCVEDWHGYALTSLGYSWILLIVYFLLPVAITAVLYRFSMCALQRSLKRRMSAVNEASRSRLAVENRRILLVLSALLAALVILVSPNRIIWIVLDYIGTSRIDHDTLISLKIFAIVPYSLHIMVNPIIYSLVDKRFRNNAKFILLHFKRRRSSGGLGLSTSGSGVIPMAERVNNYLDVSNARPSGNSPLHSSTAEQNGKTFSTSKQSVGYYT